MFSQPENNQILLNGLLTKVDAVHVLGTSYKIKYKQEGRFLTIDLTGVEKKVFATPVVVEYNGDDLKIDPKISESSDNKIRLDRITSTYIPEVAMSSWEFEVRTPGTYKISIVSNEKGNHSEPEWTGSDQKGSVQVAGKIIPAILKRDTEEINPTLFFYNGHL